MEKNISSRLTAKSIQSKLPVRWDETRVVEKRLCRESSWRDNVTVDWPYQRRSGDSGTASNQSVGEIEALTVRAGTRPPPYRVHAAETICCGCCACITRSGPLQRTKRRGAEAASNLMIAGKGYW
ncbi:hypothetical protein ACQKWADRAFT_300594 [Trichoderma austrokoningii]